MIHTISIFVISLILNLTTTPLLTSLFFCPDPELDLPVLAPDDPRREQYKQQPEPLPPQPPQTPLETPPPVFFGEPILASSSLVYVLDFSQSMGDPARRIDFQTTENRWQIVEAEARKSIEGLSPNLRFSIVVFGTNKDCGVTGWGPLKQAIDANKAQALGWLSQYQNAQLNGGATPTAPAVIVALGLKPDTIILLTDGEPSQCGVGIGQPPWLSHRKRIQLENTELIPIHVFGIGLSVSYAYEFCKGVASDSGGDFIELVYKRP